LELSRTSNKTIEIDIKVLKKIIDKNDQEGYQRLANILFFEVLTVGDWERLTGQERDCME